jgi:hypothetical protein
VRATNTMALIRMSRHRLKSFFADIVSSLFLRILSPCGVSLSCESSIPQSSQKSLKSASKSPSKMEKPVFGNRRLLEKTGFQAASTLPQVQVPLWAKALL